MSSAEVEAETVRVFAKRESGGEITIPNFVHCTVLGDRGVGKTTLTTRYTGQPTSDQYTSTVFQNYAVPVPVNGTEYAISLFETCADAVFEGIRAHTYSSCEVVLLCFSVCDRLSFFNVVDKWIPEVKRHTSRGRKRRLLLVGTQTDLRESVTDESLDPGSGDFFTKTSSSSPEIHVVGLSGGENSQNNGRFSSKTVSTEEGRKLAEIIGADCYMECSAQNVSGPTDIFRQVVLSALQLRENHKRKSVVKKLSNRLIHSKFITVLRNVYSSVRARKPVLVSRTSSTC